MVGIGAHQGVDERLRVRVGEAEGRGADAERLLARGQEGATVLHGQQGGIEGLGRGLGGFGARLDSRQARGDRIDARLRLAPLGQRPQHRADRQGNRARRRR